MHRSQMDVARDGRRTVVETDYRDLVRNRFAPLAKHRECPERHEVARSENSVECRILIEQCAHCTCTAHHGKVPVGNQAGVEPGRLHCSRPPLETVETCGHVWRARNRGDAFVALIDQVLSPAGRSSSVVDVDKVVALFFRAQRATAENQGQNAAQSAEKVVARVV